MSFTCDRLTNRGGVVGMRRGRSLASVKEKES